MARNKGWPPVKPVCETEAKMIKAQSVYNKLRVRHGELSVKMEKAGKILRELKTQLACEIIGSRPENEWFPKK